MNITSKKRFVFTGWHMMAVMVLFFGTIISVNVFMAYNAVTSWSGLVVPNTYVASQQFNGKVAQARALAASGIAGRLAVTPSDIRYDVVGADGSPVPVDRLTLNFKRPVGEHQDFSVELVGHAEGSFGGAHATPPGHWIVEAIAMRDGSMILHHAERISVRGAVR